MATVCARACVASGVVPCVTLRARRSGNAGTSVPTSASPRHVRFHTHARRGNDHCSWNDAEDRRREPTAWSVSVTSTLVASIAASIMTVAPSVVLAADVGSKTVSSVAIVQKTETTSSSSSSSSSALACAGDPSCIAERDALLSAGAYVPPTEYQEDDPDGALRRVICPRNPTADVCRSAKDRKKINDSPCKVPFLNACLVWKEGGRKS